MNFGDAFRALSMDALKLVDDGQIIGLGSGRAATAFARELGRRIRSGRLSVRAVPTSLQIKAVAEEEEIPVIDAGGIRGVDIVFDGADQIDARGYLIKGGGGALLRENVLISSAKKVVIMADKTKFVRRLSMAVPVEVHPFARSSAVASLQKIGASPVMRQGARGYPFITENGNILFDCDFGRIEFPSILAKKISGIAGVMEAGVFVRRPDLIYKAMAGGKFDVIRP